MRASLPYGNKADKQRQATCSTKYGRVTRKRTRVVLRSIGYQKVQRVTRIDFLFVGASPTSTTTGASTLLDIRLRPADIALILIDTSDEQQSKARLTQVALCLSEDLRRQDETVCYTEAGSQVYHIRGNTYLGNTGGGIGATLKAVIHLRQQQIRSISSCDNQPD